MVNALPNTPPAAGREFQYGWTVVLAAAFGVGAGITGANTYSLGVFLNPLAETFGWSRTEASASKTFLTLGYVLTAPGIGYLADRFGPRQIGIASMAALVAGMCAMTLMNGDIGVYYVSYFLLAVAGCATTPLVWTRGVATWFVAKRGLAFGLTLAGTGVAGIFAPWFIDTLIDRYTWKGGYFGMAALAAVALIPIALFFRENDAAAGKSGARPTVSRAGFDLRLALSSGHFWQLAFAFACIGGVVSSLTFHLVPILMSGGMERDQAVRIVGLLGVSVLVARIVTGFLVDRFYPPFVAGVLLVLPVIACGILASGVPASAALITFAVVCIGFAAGSEVDLLPYLTARYFGLNAYGKIYGCLFVAFYSGVGVGPLFLGWMFDATGGYASALYAAMPILAVGAAAIALLGRPPAFD